MILKITAEQARRLVLWRQGLADRPRRRLTPEGLADLIERLGFLQVDSISTVERAHHMILFARDRSYRPELLRRALEVDRRLFEHWTHDVAAILPMRFYPYWKLRFERERHVVERRFRRWHGDAHQDELGRVLDLVRAQGPIMARDLATARARPAGGWWDWHLGKTALEYLWRTGRLAIARRQGFQKVYDLAERVIPEAARQDEPDHDALIDWACRTALERLGNRRVRARSRASSASSPSRKPGTGASATLGGQPCLRSWNRRTARRRVNCWRIRTSSSCSPARQNRPPGCACSARSTRCCATGRAWSGCSRSTTVSRCSSRPRAAPTATTCFRCSSATAWSAGSTCAPIAPRRARGRMALWMEPGRASTPGRAQRLEAELERIRRFVGVDSVRFADSYLKRDG